MSPTLTTFLFELANFLVLAALLGWALFKPVRAALDARQAAERRRADALEAREKALAGESAQLDAQKAAFDEEMARLREDRLAAADTEAAAIKARAREAADRERDRQQRMLAHLERAQAERLSAAVAVAARDAVARLLSTLRAPDLDRALVHAACRQLEAGTQSPGAVLVESAAPLDVAAHTAIVAAAGAQAASVEFRVVPELGAGVRVTTARGLIDASAAGIAAQAERVLAERLAAGDSGVEHKDG